MQELLQACGRSHNLADVYAAIEAMHVAAPASWSIDLIAGLPNLTVERWQHSLDSAVAACPPHISVYDLQVRLQRRQARSLVCACMELCEVVASDTIRRRSLSS
jgi:coproporphyrinogen III oxidase-like Fe-S oxidoreductase